MNSCSLGYSNFNENENEDSNANLIKKRSNNRLQKSSNKNVEKIMEKIHKDSNDIEEGLANFKEFKPPALPEITNIKNEKKNSTSLPKETFDNLDDGSYAKQYYSQYVPQQQAPINGSGGELLDKLNYMIHLLEEQKDEKIANISEEIILYAFLGIFIIFIVDSFVRVGKYVR